MIVFVNWVRFIFWANKWLQFYNRVTQSFYTPSEGWVLKKQTKTKSTLLTAISFQLLVIHCILERFSFECRKVIGFAITTLRDWLKRFAPLFHPIRSKTKTNRDALACIFPRFASATCNYFEFWLVHCIVCSLWLARVITLVLVLRHSNENHSIHCLAYLKIPRNRVRINGVQLCLQLPPF